MVPPVLFHLGFRVFFLGAAAVALAAMAMWAVLLRNWLPAPAGPLPAAWWHGHEMIYGYGLAVVAGFLLTAVGNWTGRRTLHGWPLALLAASWLTARLAVLGTAPRVSLAALADGLFWGGLVLAVVLPIVRARQWRQLGIVAKLVLLGVGQSSFYAAALGAAPDLARGALHGGLYLLVALILTIAGRVLPGFIERGVGDGVRIAEPRWAMPATALLFLPFFVAVLGALPAIVGAASAAALALVVARRLLAWHTVGLWQRPLLWGLYLAVVAIAVGFLLHALAWHWPVLAGPALHAFAVGGVGLATLSMMARVALGHSGRDIRRPPAAVGVMLALLVTAVLLRVAGVAIVPGRYLDFVSASQIAWCSAFALFLFAYTPILVRPRIDGRPG